MKKYKPFLLTVILIFCLAKVNAQIEKYKSVFVYQIIKYVEWPDEEGEFVIGVLGESEIYDYLLNIAKKKNTNGRAIVIRQFADPGSIQECDILYISKRKKGALELVLASGSTSHTLIITENRDLCEKGSGINFIRNGESLGFELCNQNIKTAGLKVSSELEKLATRTF